MGKTYIAKNLPLAEICPDLSWNPRHHPDGVKIITPKNILATDLPSYDLQSILHETIRSYRKVVEPCFVDGSKANRLMRGFRRVLSTMVWDATENKVELVQAAYANEFAEAAGKDSSMKIDNPNDVKALLGLDFAKIVKECTEGLKTIPCLVYSDLTEAERDEIVNDDGGKKPLARSEVFGGIIRAFRKGLKDMPITQQFFRGLARLQGGDEVRLNKAVLLKGQARDKYITAWFRGKMQTLRKIFNLGPKFIRQYLLCLLDAERILSDAEKLEYVRNLVPNHRELSEDELKDNAHRNLGLTLTDTRVEEIHKVCDEEEIDCSREIPASIFAKIKMMIADGKRKKRDAVENKAKGKTELEAISKGFHNITCKDFLGYLAGSVKDFSTGRIEFIDGAVEKIEALAKYLDLMKKDHELAAFYPIVLMLAHEGPADLEKLFQERYAKQLSKADKKAS